MDLPLTPEVKLTNDFSTDSSTSEPEVTPETSKAPNPTPKSLTADRLED